MLPSTRLPNVLYWGFLSNIFCLVPSLLCAIFMHLNQCFFLSSYLIESHTVKRCLQGPSLLLHFLYLFQVHPICASESFVMLSVIRNPNLSWQYYLLSQYFFSRILLLLLIFWPSKERWMKYYLLFKIFILLFRTSYLFIIWWSIGLLNLICWAGMNNNQLALWAVKLFPTYARYIHFFRRTWEPHVPPMLNSLQKCLNTLSYLSCF